MASSCFSRVKFWATVPAKVLGLRFGFMIIPSYSLETNVPFARGFHQPCHDLSHKVCTAGNGHP
jgi:hypothetical protein